MDSRSQIRFVSRVVEATKAKQVGDTEQVEALMNEAIKILNSTGKENPDLYIFRELLLTDMADLPETNWDKVEEATNEAYELYKQQGNGLGQIDTLISLAGLSLITRKTEAARRYLDQASNLIDVISPRIIYEHLPDWSLLTGENFLQLRQAEVNRLREFLI